MSTETRSAARADFGVDAPYAPVGMILGGFVFLLLFVIFLIAGGAIGLILWWLLWTLLMWGMAGLYLHTTRRGKRAVWAELVDGMGLSGDERALDLGCGRGLVLLTVAARLTTGTAVGVDLWRIKDQSGNTEAVTRRNAEALGVADRIELRTADITELPMPDDSVDLVVSSLAIHNIPAADRRAAAIREAARVLRPGGRLAIADFRHTAVYARQLAEAGLADVRRRGLGWRFWYGGPWAGTTLVTARKPD